MDIEMTVPYSPSQNGVAERMNRTLVELARAMLQASKLPEFLWECAVAHAAYLRNRAYTSVIIDKTSYKGWQRKPNVTHLREFSTPVWILLQGQNKAQKILLKSQRRTYVGQDDASKSVLYFNAQTRKILTSCNYVFLNTKDEQPSEEIFIREAPSREGEREEESTRKKQTLPEDNEPSTSLEK